jgi:ATP adenylyltransferase
MSKSGALWSKTVRASERALKKGALRPINTEGRIVRDGDVDFVIRIVSNLARKAEAKEKRERDGGAKKVNPFLPYEPDMFVADMSPSHICLLNKFNVIDNHLLIVTRDFEDQENLLNERDFYAICLCMGEFEGLAFYNGGQVAGASERHKHLQMTPLPMGDEGLGVPMEALFTGANNRGGITRVPGFEFLHSFAKLPAGLRDTSGKGSKLLHSLYREMLEAVGLNKKGPVGEVKQSGPYNLLFTRRWMLLVPRSREFFKTISVNAIGFAGGLLAKNQHEMEVIIDEGPFAVLKGTTIN